MKETLRQLCSPILKPLESGDVGPNYKASHRTILNVVGALFLTLSTVSAAALVFTGQLGALVPVLVFLGIGGLSLIVGTLGTDAAVSRMWGNR
ncbi:hypothetical protein QQF73_00995 [Marinobacter sp. M216]|uniref:Uncharacterized protein n=1 Tax=Marinobacter albus TaxID=3030833 RepID=A0ABT7H813_9GAMM|nr:MULTISPECIES: hypothetical protein [unclassified Marinobacter]MBW7471539.1 hypothetical protein [Marinobacter sp. F4218]MDK9556182.1 hypothetical protein [Marinobacter sp. M216]